MTTGSSSATTGSSSAQVSNPKKKGWRLKTPWATVVASIVTAAGGYFVAHATGTTAAAQTNQPLPSVHIIDVTWVLNGHGRYEVTGTARNLTAGEVLWTFNQPISQNTPLTIYPDPGPCAADDNGIFKCSLGFATGTPSDYNIIVAVVTDQQAYDFALQKERLVTSANYLSTSDIPHVTGPNTLDSEESTRTNCDNCHG
jgi:hypothetical protein